MLRKKIVKKVLTAWKKLESFHGDYLTFSAPQIASKRDLKIKWHCVTVLVIWSSKKCTTTESRKESVEINYDKTIVFIAVSVEYQNLHIAHQNWRALRAV